MQFGRLPIATNSNGALGAPAACTCDLMPRVLADSLPQVTVAVLTGPSFAAEIAVDGPEGACAP